MTGEPMTGVIWRTAQGFCVACGDVTLGTEHAKEHACGKCFAWSSEHLLRFRPLRSYTEAHA